MSANHPLRYSLQIGDDVIPVREITGREAVSAPFRFELRFALEHELSHEPEALLKRGAALRMAREHDLVRVVHGVITELSVRARNRGVTEVRAVVEPQLALLRHRADHRLFREKTVPEIVTEVLRVVGIVPGASEPASRLVLRLSSSYSRRPYTVQHDESDLDFVHRLLEDEGIYYYFLEHEGLVLGDSPAAYEPIAGTPLLPFRPGHGMNLNDDAVTEIGGRASVTVGKVSLRDLDLERPSLDLSAAAPGPTPGGPEHYDYPGEYADPGEGARAAALRAQAHACAAVRVSGSGTSGRLVPGHTFSLEGTPEGTADGQHVLLAVRHAWKLHEEGFACAFESLPASITYRPPRVTKEPRQWNLLTGIVTGPAGEDIHTDAHGRVKVHFPWDRIHPFDDDCSHWIPVLQDNTGHSVALPRVGWEVLVGFLEGDADRPVVLGRLYNGEYRFPVPLPADKTKSSLKSLSSPGRNGTNQIQIDDAAGREEVSILAEKDQTINVAHDKSSTTLHDESLDVTRDEIIKIGNDQKQTVGADFTHAVEHDQARTVMGSRKRSVNGTEASTVAKDRRLTIGGTHFRRIGTDDLVRAENLTEKVGAVNLEASIKSNTTTSSLTTTFTVGGALLELSKDDKKEDAKVRIETVGGLTYTSAGQNITTAVRKNRTVTVGGLMSVTSAEDLTVLGKTALSAKAATGTFSAKSLTLKVGETFVELKDGTLSINAKKRLTFSIPGSDVLDTGGIAIIPASAGKLSAEETQASAQEAEAEGETETGLGSVAVSALSALSGALGKAKPKGAANPPEVLGDAAKAGYDFDPDHCEPSVQQTAQSYAAGMGIRQGTDGMAIPLSGNANAMVGALDQRAADYAAASPAQRAELRDAGLAWETVSRDQAAEHASRGDLVLAGLDNPRGAGHVATVLPGGETWDDGDTYPYVAGGGSEAGRSDGSKTVADVWGESTRQDVKYYRFVPPAS